MAPIGPTFAGAVYSMISSARSIIEGGVPQGRARLRGLEVQDHLEFCREPYRQIARLLTAQNTDACWPSLASTSKRGQRLVVRSRKSM